MSEKTMSSDCAIAKEKEYKIVSRQIRVDNTASLVLHRALGFETDGAVFQTQKGTVFASI